MERFLKQAEEKKSGSWNKQKKRRAVLETSRRKEERFLKQAASGSWNKQPLSFLFFSWTM